MTKANDLASLLDANGDVVSSALDNVPASDLVNDTTPQLSGTLDTNGNDITFADNDKAIFGAGSDLQIYHNGSSSYITDQGSGNLVLGGDIAIILQNAAHTANMIDAYNGGRVGLYHANSLKLATTASGCDVTGGLNTTGSVGIGCTPDSALEIRTATNSSSDTTYIKLSNLGENVGHIDFENGNGNLARITGTKLGAGASANDGILTFSASLDSVLTEHMRIDGATGNVGIGTASPAELLHCSLPSGTNGDIVRLSRSAGAYSFQLGVSSGSTSNLYISDSSNNKIIDFTSSGNVGIGTVSPTQALVVSESSTPTIQIKDGAASGTRVSGRLHIGEADNLGVSIENSTNSYNDNCTMVFKTSPAAGTITERLRITSTGKVETSNRNFGFHNHNTIVSLADDASIVINAVTAGSGLLAIYETASGNNALFRAGYGSCELLGSGQGGSNMATSDTDGKICVFSSPANHTITIKNRLGGTKGFYINMFMAGNDFAG